MRDVLLAVLVVALGLFEWWGSCVDRRLEARTGDAMSPYIVTTWRPCPERHTVPVQTGDGGGYDDGGNFHCPPCAVCDDRCEVAVSRCAVATLEEARWAVEMLPAVSNAPNAQTYYDEMESWDGGEPISLPPLPDGTVIEVKPGDTMSDGLSLIERAEQVASSPMDAAQELERLEAEVERLREQRIEAACAAFFAPAPWPVVYTDEGLGWWRERMGLALDAAVVPCDDAAAERAVRALAPYAWHDKDTREIVEIVLRAAGETP